MSEALRCIQHYGNYVMVGGNVVVCGLLSALSDTLKDARNKHNFANEMAEEERQMREYENITTGVDSVSEQFKKVIKLEKVSLRRY